jgi:uncharacterized membrane protein YdjX (TVP38/TMEM64 family)
MTRSILILAAVIVLLAVAFFAGREALGLLPRFSAWVQELGPLGPLVFMSAYGLAAIALFPAVTLTLAAGALFGLLEGVLYVMLGATFGAALAFLNGLRLVLLLRLSPAVPYTLLNYALGLSRVRFRDYILGSIGMLPAVTMYVYSGKVAGDLASLASGAVAPRGPAYYVLLGIGLAATVAVTVVITRIARKAIDEAVSDQTTT